MNLRVKFQTLLCTFALSCLSSLSLAQAAWQTYQNDPFSYSISYPADLFNEPTPDKRQGGITLDSVGGDARLYIFGGVNRGRETTFSLAHGLAGLDEVHRVTYRRVADNWFVLSGYLAGSGDIFYERIELNADRTFLAGFRLEYPSSLRQTFDHQIGRIGRSLTFDGR